MRFGSLFSGIGGLDLGLERAGMECAWQVEIDEWCRAVLARHWPDVPRWDDAKTFPPDPIGYGLERQQQGWAEARPALGVDLICGGFPCQPVSLAGKRRGQDDERWLWPEFARIVRLLRPRYVLVENVPGLLARGMGDVLGDLAASGYDCEWDCIPAAAVGAPHLRYRVFIVAHRRSERRQQDTASSQGDESSNGRWPEGDYIFGGQGPRYGTSAQWTTEPNVGRVAHGVPSRVDRLRGLGNAVVPQVAEWIGRRLMEMDA
jgi:DNA (cytosine-5)-methyltransferase 1